LCVNKTAILLQDKEVSYITLLVLLFRQSHGSLQWRQDLFANSLERVQCLNQLRPGFGHFQSDTLLQRYVLAGSQFDFSLSACHQSLVVTEDRKFHTDAGSRENSIGATSFELSWAESSSIRERSHFARLVATAIAISAARRSGLAAMAFSSRESIGGGASVVAGQRFYSKLGPFSRKPESCAQAFGRNLDIVLESEALLFS
jgi:hypothetical protein